MIGCCLTVSIVSLINEMSISIVSSVNEMLPSHMKGLRLRICLHDIFISSFFWCCLGD